MPLAPPSGSPTPLTIRDDLDGLQELIKSVLGVLPRQHQQPAVALLLQRRHLLTQLRLGQRGALRCGGVPEEGMGWREGGRRMGASQVQDRLADAARAARHQLPAPPSLPNQSPPTARSLLPWRKAQ